MSAEQLQAAVTDLVEEGDHCQTGILQAVDNPSHGGAIEV